MAGIMRKGISWLGLGPEEDYDDYNDDYFDDTSYGADSYGSEAVVDITADRSPDPAVRPVPPSRVAAARSALSQSDEDSSEPAVRVVGKSGGSRPRAMPAGGAGSPAGASTSEAQRPRSVVRSLPNTADATPTEVTPESFNDAQQIGDLFKRQRPVLMTLRGLDRELARRLLDFASGVSYALGGSVERVASKVYLLTPPGVTVDADGLNALLDDDS